MFYRLLYLDYIRDKVYGYLELVFEMVEVEYDVFVLCFLDYYNKFLKEVFVFYLVLFCFFMLFSFLDCVCFFFEFLFKKCCFYVFIIWYLFCVMFFMYLW